jgi:parallel beta-helix repeat protein
MKETANRYAIALLSVIMVCLLAVPAMAANLDELETRCWDGSCLNGTITNGTVIVMCNMTGLPTIGNWTFTLPEGDVEIAYMHWHRWGACHGTDITAEFWNGTGAYESIGFDYPDEDPVVYEDHGVWFTEYSPRNGNHHYYWKVNASAGTNTFNATGCYETDGEHCDARWFIAVINNTDTGNRTHDGHWWHNTGYEKTRDYPLVEQETWYYNASGNPINTAANYTLWTAQTHYGSSTPSIEFNGESVGNVGSGCDGHGDGQYADYSLCKFNVPSTLIEADGDQHVKWKYDNDAYYVNFGTLAEAIPKPDLVITDIEPNATTLRANTSYTINATVKNIGSANVTDTFNLCLSVNGSYYNKTSVTGLNVSESKTVSFARLVNLTNGCHTFKVVADCDGDIPESCETNNETTVKYQVGYVIVVESDSDFEKLNTSGDCALPSGCFKNESGTYYIQNLTGSYSIENCAGEGITIKNTNATFVINNCTIKNCTGSGVFLHDLKNGTINGSKILNNAKYGIKVGEVSLGSDDPEFVDITNNTINGSKTDGIDLVGFNCTVKDNTISNSTVYGIYLLANDTDITNGNEIRDNGNYGIKAYNSSRNNIHCNTFTDNNVSGHQAWDNGNTNNWNSTDADDDYIGNRWKDWKDNSGYPCNYTIDGGSNVDKRPKGFYDFLTGAGEDKWAFKDEVDGSPGPGDPSDGFTTYANIAADDDLEVCDVTTTAGYYAAHRFNFSIDETDPEKINVTWIGKGDHDSNPSNTYDGAYLYIWNFTSVAYEELANNSGDDDEVTLTGGVVVTPSNYVNSGNVTILVNQTSADAGRNHRSHIETDYVKLVVTP